MALEISYFSLCFMLACNKIHENYFSRQLRQIQKKVVRSRREVIGSSYTFAQY